jgi:hypothetical protein
MDAYDNDQNATDMLFDAIDSGVDTLTLEDGNELYIPSGETFLPAGNLESGTIGINDIKIVGIYTASSGETIRVSGSWISSGTFTASTSTVTFDAPGATTETINSTSPFNIVVLNDGGGGATFQLGGAMDVNSNLTITGGTLSTGSNYQINVGGTFTNNDIFTANSGTVVMDGTAGSIVGTTNTAFYELTIDPTSTGTVTLTTSSPTVSNSLSIASGDTFSLSSEKTITLLSSSSLTLTGTISGAGTLIYQSTNAFPATGVISTPLRMDSASGNQTISGRNGSNNFASNVELYNNSGTARTYTMGTDVSQTIEFAGNLTLNANSGTISLNAANNNPIVNISGNLSFATGGSAESITSGSSAWTVLGNVDFSNGSYTATSGNTLKMSGSGKTITSAGSTLQKFEVTGGSISSVDAMDVNSTFTLTSGTFTQGANVNLNIAGNVTFQSGTTFTKASGSGVLILDGDLIFDDNTAGQNLGDVFVGTSPDTTILSSDMVADTITVNSGDIMYTCEYDLDAGAGGVIIIGTLDASASGGGNCSVNEANESQLQTDGDFDLRSGATFTPDQSTVDFTATSGTVHLYTVGTGSLYNLLLSGSGQTVNVEDSVAISNYVNIGTGASLDTVSSENNQITVGGNWTNTGTFNEREGKVIFNGSGISILSYSADETFHDFEVATGGKQIRFDDTYQTIISGLFNIQGIDCSTGRVFLSSETNSNDWPLNITGTYDVDYADIRDSTANSTTVANNSTADNLGNTNWTINAGVCGAPASNIFTKVFRNVMVKAGVKIK